MGHRSLFADQLPVVALGAAIVHINRIAGGQSVAAFFGIIKGNVWSAANTPLAWIVEPGTTVFLVLVKGLMD